MRPETRAVVLGCSLTLQGKVGAKGAASLRHEHKMLSIAMQKRGTRVWEYGVKMVSTHRGHMCRHICLVV